MYTWNGQPDHATTKGLGKNRVTSLNQGNTEAQRITLNAFITYKHTFNEEHYLKVMAGTERQNGFNTNLSASRRNFISDKIDQLFAGAPDQYMTNDGSANEYARLNYFGRVNYDFSQKYLVEFVWRYDGSYKFAKGHQFGFFPGVSLGWRVSEEKFWKEKFSFINDFKIRGSWGQTGNDRIKDYQFLASYEFDWLKYVVDGEQQLIMEESRIPNPIVTWEVANQSNIGFDAQLLDNKLSVSAEYFYNKRSNILWWRNASIPTSSGLTLPRENIGEVANQGFEFLLAFRNSVGDFSYDISLNGGYSDSKILFWDETPGIPDYQKSTGKPVPTDPFNETSDMYYQAIGIFKDQAAIDAYPHWKGAQPGDIIFEDYNKDGEIDELDMVRDHRNTTPKFNGGLNIDLRYKMFDLSVFLQGSAGAVVYYMAESGTWANFTKDDYDGRWTEENPNASKPRAYNWNVDYWTYQPNTFYLRDNDFIRLKNVEVGFNMPEKVNNALGINALRLYVNGNNLAVISKVKRMDPEQYNNRTFNYGLQRIISAGLTITF